MPAGLRRAWLIRHDARYRAKHGVPGDPEPVPPGSEFKPAAPRTEPPPPGPGTELKAILAALGVAPKGCACNARARQMDANGIEWCRANRDEIAGWLRDEAGKRGWGDVFAAGARAVLSGLAFRLDPADVYGSLVDIAIERAERKAAG